MIQNHNDDMYKQGIQNVLKSVILYSTSFRKIASDLGMLYSANEILPYDYTALFLNFYERTNQLIESISFTLAELVRRSTLQDSVRSRTTNSLKKEILEDSFQELRENLNQFRNLITDLGISIDSKIQENEYLSTSLTAGTIGTVLSGTRKLSYIDGTTIASMLAQSGQNAAQIAQLRQSKVDMALTAMVSTTSLLKNLTVKLMDQYCSLVYGGSVNLDTRDYELNVANEDVNSIADTCNHIALLAKDIYDKAIFNIYQQKYNSGKTWIQILFAIGLVCIIGSAILESVLFALLGLALIVICVKKNSNVPSSSPAPSSFIREINNTAATLIVQAEKLKELADKNIN